MMTYEEKKLFRCWHGYRLIFEFDKYLNLDKDMVPIAKYPVMHDNQMKYAIGNIKRTMRGLDAYAWLFIFSVAVSNGGILPHPFGLDLSQKTIDGMHQDYRRFLLHDHKADLEKLKGIGTFEIIRDKNLMNMLLKGEFSIIAIMMYHRQIEQLDISEYSKGVGLIAKRIGKLLRHCFDLEMRYLFSTRIDELVNNRIGVLDV